MCHVYINVNVMRREDFFMEKHRKTDDAGVQKRWMIVTDNEGRIVAERLFRKDWIDYHIAHAIMIEQLELPDPELAKQLRWYSAGEPMRQIYEKLLQKDPDQMYVTITALGRQNFVREESPV